MRRLLLISSLRMKPKLLRPPPKLLLMPKLKPRHKLRLKRLLRPRKRLARSKLLSMLKRRHWRRKESPLPKLRKRPRRQKLRLKLPSKRPSKKLRLLLKEG